jgi:hypothetical protein
MLLFSVSLAISEYRYASTADAGAQTRDASARHQGAVLFP